MFLKILFINSVSITILLKPSSTELVRRFNNVFEKKNNNKNKNLIHCLYNKVENIITHI